MRLVIKIGVAMLACYAFLLALVYFNGTNDDVMADVGVVYGNKVELTGEPSPRLKARLEAAVELYQEQRIKKIIVSGGVGKEGFDEAKVMAKFLVNQGVSEQDIIIDSQGLNSNMTSQNAKLLLASDAMKMDKIFSADKIKIVAISQRYHLLRAKLSLTNAGFTQVYGYAPDYWEWRDLYSYQRELPAIVKYWINNLNSG